MKEQQIKETSCGYIVISITLIIGVIMIFGFGLFKGFIICAIGGIIGIPIQIYEHKIYQAQQKRMQNEHKNHIDNLRRQEKHQLVSKYGEITKIIPIEEDDLNKSIIVFEKTNCVVINGLEMSMDDILRCTYVDNTRTEKGAVAYESKTENGSLIKRAIVGNLLLGSAGAIIGGATAKTTTTIVRQDNDTIYHDYTIIVNINSLSSPIIKINLGQDGSKVDEIIGLMNVIINRRNNASSYLV